MLLIKFVPNIAPLEGPILELYIYDAKFAPNLMQICPRYYQKSAFAALLYYTSKNGANKVQVIRTKVRALKFTNVWLE